MKPALETAVAFAWVMLAICVKVLTIFDGERE